MHGTKSNMPSQRSSMQGKEFVQDAQDEQCLISQNPLGQVKLASKG